MTSRPNSPITDPGRLISLGMVDRPSKASLSPDRWQFLVRLEDEDWFFPATTFARTEDRAKENLQDRFSGKIAEFRLRKPPMVG